MPFPIEQIDTPSAAYVSDSLGVLSTVEFPLSRGFTVPEQDLFKREIKDRVELKARKFVKTIADQVAERTKKDPLDVAVTLCKHINNRYIDIDEIEGIDAYEPIEGFDEFKQILAEEDRLIDCIRVYLMIKRTTPDKSLKWNPDEWTIESALDPKEMSTEHRSQISYLSQLEQGGKAHYCIETRINKEGEAVNVFYFSAEKYDIAKKKYEGADDKKTSKEDEAAEELAKN